MIAIITVNFNETEVEVIRKAMSYVTDPQYDSDSYVAHTKHTLSVMNFDMVNLPVTVKNITMEIEKTGKTELTHLTKTILLCALNLYANDMSNKLSACILTNDIQMANQIYPRRETAKRLRDEIKHL